MEGYHSLPFTLPDEKPTFFFISVTKKAAKVDLYEGINKIVRHMALYFPFRSAGPHRCEVTEVLKALHQNQRFKHISDLLINAASRLRMLMMSAWRGGGGGVQNPRPPCFHRGIHVLACILSPTLHRSENLEMWFERSKQNPPVPLFDHFLYAHLAFQATYHNLHFLSAHWNNRELLEPSGTSEAVFCAQRFKYSTLCSLFLQIHFSCFLCGFNQNTACSFYIWALFDKQHTSSHADEG